MDAGKALVLALLVSCLAAYTNGVKQSCERIKNYNGDYQECTCQYMMDDKPSGIVSLYQVAKRGKPLFPDQSTNDTSRDKTKYSYNPCLPFTEKTCQKTAVCQAASPTLYYPVGFQNTTEYGVAADGNVTLTYTAGPRTAIVTLICDPSLTGTPKFVAVGEFSNEKEHYFFYLHHRCACPGECVPPGLGGLSDGSIIVIIFFVLVAVYFIGGMIFLKFVRHEEGADIIPNRSFWSSLPGLIKGYNISSALSYVEGQVMKSSSDIIKLLDLYESTMNASATTISRPWPIEQLD